MPKQPKTPRETWRDWELPGTAEPDELVTRDAIIAALRREHLTVTPDNFRDWQSAGVIPYGVNRWHDGAVRTLYPGWMLTVIRTVHELRAQGWKMPEVRDRVRAVFRDRTAPFVVAVPTGTATAKGYPPTIHHAPIELKSISDSATFVTVETVTVQKTIDPPADLAPRLAELSRLAEQALGSRYPRAEVRLIDEDGVPLVFRFDISPA